MPPKPKRVTAKRNKGGKDWGHGKPKRTSVTPLSPKPFQPNQPPVKVTSDGQELWELETVVASRLMWEGRLYYQVAWKGWSKDEYWYPASSLKRSPYLLIEFHSINHNDAGPPKRIEFWDKAYEKSTEEGLERHEDDDLQMDADEKMAWLESVRELWADVEELESEVV